MVSTETELKLAVDATSLKRVPRLPAIVAAKQGRAITRDLVSTYYDTADFSLRRAGITLRLRRQGRDWVQTVKQAGLVQGGLFQRPEWEMVLAQPQLNVPHLLATGLPPLKQEGLIERLEPIFTTEIRRTTYILADRDWEMELALDHGLVRAGDRQSPVAEIEMELRRGDTRAIFALARAIAQSLPCRVQPLSKSERGHALATDGGAKPVKAKPPLLAGDMDTPQALAVIVQDCVAQLGANQPALEGQHCGEAVHQMRVALRRLRSAVKIFKPLLPAADLAWLRPELRWLLDQLGPARDCEVFLTEIVVPALEQHPDIPALAELRGEFHRQRDATLAVARAAIASPRFTLLQLDLGRWALAPAMAAPCSPPDRLDGFARKVLKRQWRRLLKAGGHDLADLRAEDLHELRIIGKQMRYGAEFFAGLYAKAEIKPILTALASLQQNLGELNDLAVAAPRLAQAGRDAGAQWASGLIGGWHENRRPALMKAARSDWKHLRKSTPPWN